MTVLIVGLIVFLGAHSVRIFADPWRAQCIEKWGSGRWKGVYSLFSLVGLLLLVVGFDQARTPVVVVWEPPLWMWHVTVFLNAVASVLFTAAYVPRNAIQRAVQDPMILGVKTWALAHLVSNGTQSAIVLFGSFLLWAVLDFRACRKRRALLAAVPNSQISVVNTALCVLIGLAAWLLIAGYAHRILIGISPLAWF